MSLLSHVPTAGHTVLASVPEGADALVLANLFERHGALVYVARDDARMARMQEALHFFTPDIKTYPLPAWDCLPYDRVSPHARVVSERVETLCRLAIASEKNTSKMPFILLTTVNSLLQRIPPLELLKASTFETKRGATLERDTLVEYLVHNGYIRTSSVTEPGEFALRGSIIDIFPSGAEEGLRLDFFGDTVESIRGFDPLTQISGSSQESLFLYPASEILLNEKTIGSFRLQYRSLFGAVTNEDPLYEAVSEGRKYAGMEHWLPLFYDKLDTLFDLLPSTPFVFDHLTDAAHDERLKIIEDYYQARLETGERGLSDGVQYHPVKPEALYLNAQQWNWELGSRVSYHFTPFTSAAMTVNDQKTSTHNVNLQFSAVPDFSAESKKTGTSGMQLVADYLSDAPKDKHQLIACFSEGSRDRIGRMLKEMKVSGHPIPLKSWDETKSLKLGHIGLAIWPLEKGFTTPDTLILSEQDILGERISRAGASRKKRSENFLSEAASLTPGELVVHREHGVGKFEGLETLTVSGEIHDFLRIIYDGDDKLYVPVENIDVLTRYGSEEGIKLDKLGSAAWQTRKARLKKRIQIAAEELLRIAAERELREAPELVPLKGMYEEFCARFPYAETEDQLRAIEEVEEDLRSGRPMDRLICGDVGFGKTEVALRAAFIAISAAENTGKPIQVAVIVPTTLLSRQHYKSFSERFSGFPVRIRQLSRLVSNKEAAATREEIKNGSVDIIIGTHAVLSKQIEFSNLGLLIIDEEQHFGVAQKERLKQLRSEVHILTLSATPIPRTLQMSLSGIKSLSLIATPPVDRLAVRTFVMPYDPVILREAILREHYRGGRTFYVCPRISDLADISEKLRELVPEVKIVTAHGQLSGTELDDIMNAFYDGRFDVLLSTTIVESGLDIPMANTIIIHRADRFGLSQLYQLRGRVGRGKVRAYAYLTTPVRHKPTDTALKRLEVMQSLDTLGAGFSVASHDMDIRGFGNLVGEEQSGQVREVGIELYQDMLKEAIEKARQGKAAEDLAGAAEGQDEQWSPQINLGISVLIPEDYVEDLQLRLGLYRRIAYLTSEAEVEGFAAELIDRFGALPQEVEHLLAIVKLKQLCRAGGIDKVETGPKGMLISFRNNHFNNPAKLLEFIAKNAKSVKLRSDHKLVISEEWASSEQRLKSVRDSVSYITKLAA